MSNKKILLIGGYGFLGSNILEWAENNSIDADFTVISSLRTISAHKTFKCVKEELFGDFGNDLFLGNAFINNEYDYIFHCLTSTTPVNSNTAIISDIQTNLINMIKLLDIIKLNSATLVFFSSGGAIYGNSKSIIHKVEDVPNPVSSYGIVKNTIEQYIQLYHKLYGLKYLNLRISNPYGYFHKSSLQGLINIAIRKSINNQPVEIWGDGENVKDYIFAQDIPPIIFSLLKKEYINTTVNIGSGQGTSINALLKLLEEINPFLVTTYKPSKLHDVKDFVLDISEIKTQAKFTPLREGIIKTYNWEKGNFDK